MPESTDSLVQSLNWDTAPRIKERVPAVERIMSADQAAAYTAGKIEARPAVILPADAVPQAPPPAPVPGTPALPVQQMAPPAPSAQPASLAPQPLPERTASRIDRLLGQRDAANERSQLLEQRLMDTTRRLEFLESGQSRQPAAPPASNAPWTNQFGSSSPGFAADPNSAPPAGDYVSRRELQAIVDRTREESRNAIGLYHAQLSSSGEAIRDFPDVFNDPGLRADADRLLREDPHLSQDPHGPYKAAAMARGLRGFENRVGPAQIPAADQRKAEISGLGITVPEGSGSQDPRQRYLAAFQRARETQRPDDWLAAMRLAEGL